MTCVVDVDPTILGAITVLASSIAAIIAAFTHITVKNNTPPAAP